MEQHPIVVAAIDKLARSCNASTGITNVIDRSKAIDLFYALLDCGFSFNYPLIHEQLVEHGWATEHALAVADLAELTSIDGYIEVDYPLNWGRRVVEQLMAESANDYI